MVINEFKFLRELCKSISPIDRRIRFVGIVNHDGKLLTGLKEEERLYLCQMLVLEVRMNRSSYYRPLLKVLKISIPVPLIIRHFKLVLLNLIVLC